MARLFLSHSSKDKTFVFQLATDLKEAGHQVWLDDAEIHVGDSIIDKIGDGIENSDAVVLVLSKHSVASEWVAREWRTKFLEEINKRKVLVLPIIKDNCRIPALLREKRCAKFSKSYALGFAELLHALSVAGERSGLLRSHKDFVDIKDDAWRELCERTKHIDLLIMYGDTWRNQYLKHLRSAIAKKGGMLRVILPDVGPSSLLPKLFAVRLGKTVAEVRARVDNAIHDFKTEFPKKKVQIYTTSAYLNHAAFLFDTGGILALYAYKGRVPTPAFHVVDGFLLDFLQADFNWLLDPESGFCRRIH